MSRFAYAGIELSPCQVRYEKTPVWDGPVLVAVLHRIHVKGCYNPAATSYDIPGKTLVPVPFPAQDAPQALAVDAGNTLPGPVQTGWIPPVTPTPARGGASTAPVTDVAIRSALMSPRQKLYYLVGNKLMLLSPALRPDLADGTQYTVDAANGPLPLSCVVTPRGDKTFMVEWSGETQLVESDLFESGSGSQGSISVLLSHRWTMQDTIDQDAFTTRTITGRAIFRTDRMKQLSRDPDDYRGWLFPPCGHNFKRDHVEVYPSPDGSQLYYVVHDRETAYGLGIYLIDRHVTRVEAFFTTAATGPSYSRMKRAAAEISIGLANNLASNTLAVGQAIASSNFSPGSWPGPITSAAGAAISAAAATMQAAITWDWTAPIKSYRLIVRVWGNWQAERQDLHDVALAIADVKLKALVEKYAATNVTFTEDLTQNFVEFQASVETGPGRTLLYRFPDFRPLSNEVVPYITALGQRPTLPADSNTRGTLGNKAVAAAITDPTEHPDRPPVPDQFSSEQPP